MTYRDEVSGMNDTEAKEYLLDLLDEQEHHLCLIADHVRVGKSSLRLLMIMDQARARVVSHDHIARRFYEMNRLYDGKDYFPVTTDIASYAKRLRRALEEMNVPIKIESVYGFGYRMIKPEGWVAPWNKGPVH